jgi:hypothetical protein
VPFSATYRTRLEPGSNPGRGDVKPATDLPYSDIINVSGIRNIKTSTFIIKFLRLHLYISNIPLTYSSICRNQTRKFIKMFVREIKKKPLCHKT